MQSDGVILGVDGLSDGNVASGMDFNIGSCRDSAESGDATRPGDGTDGDGVEFVEVDVSGGGAGGEGRDVIVDRTEVDVVGGTSDEEVGGDLGRLR